MKRFCKDCGQTTDWLLLSKNSGSGIGAKQLRWKECQTCGTKEDERITVNEVDKNWGNKTKFTVSKQLK